MATRPDWSRDETILALDLYFKAWPIYIFRLDGISPANFEPPDGTALGKRHVYKIGWCVDLEKRLKTLNSGLPRGTSLRWVSYDKRGCPSRDAAYTLEQQLFGWVRDKQLSLGGEFVLADFGAIARIQTEWFAVRAGKIG
jgi:hypothetical protein